MQEIKVIVGSNLNKIFAFVVKYFSHTKDRMVSKVLFIHLNRKEILNDVSFHMTHSF